MAGGAAPADADAALTIAGAAEKDGGDWRRRSVVPIVVGIVLLCVAVAIGWAVKRGLTADLDALLLLEMAGGPSEFWLIPTRIGDQAARVAILAAGAVALLVRHHRHRAGMLIAVVLAGAALNSGLKLLFTRVRPGLLPHLDHVDTFSFPSGHAANSMTLALALALLVAPVRRRVPAVVVAVTIGILIGLSRLALAVHWPSDVVAGWIEGIGFTCLWFGIRRRWRGMRNG